MHRVMRALLVVLLSSSLTAGVAIAASSMAGETFTGTWTLGSVDVVPAVTANCVDLVSGTVKYLSATATGSTAVAAGPFPGFYVESGTVTLAGGAITGWTASWSVASTAGGEPYVTGTKTLSLAGTGPFICQFTNAAGTLNATLSFTANGAPGSPPAGVPAFVGPTSGSATASLTFNTTSLGNPPTAGTASGTFSEIFQGSAPIVGCDNDRDNEDTDRESHVDNDRDSHGDNDTDRNDECEQEGEN